MATSTVGVAAPGYRTEVAGQDGEKGHRATMLASQDTARSYRVLRTFRCLVADLCEQFKGGHPGSAMGMAAMGIALWKYIMRYSPENPNYFNRDRFVLSNGHACLFQYTLMHLVGYRHMTLEQLRSYHSDRIDSFCPGHPEIEHEGIEVTTGPLGQGIANAVGMAMATKHLAATYNKPGFPVVSNKIWCVVGDACLQEGVALEAISLAGHWRLNDLIVIYDNNQITCDGSVDLANTEDVNAKMVACGWRVLAVDDGDEDIPAIVDALEQARAEPTQPVFINIRTTIGVGSKVAGDAKAHGVALGPEDVANLKRESGMNADEHFVISDETYGFFADIRERGRRYEQGWAELVEAYGKAYPDVADEFACRVRGEMVKDWTKIIPPKEAFPTTPTASRKSAGLVCNPLAAELSNIMVGTADLSPSVNMIWKGKVDFQHPDLRPTCGITGDYTGRYIHWGIREHAMAAISNGLAAYNKGTILPITSSFFMFYLYAAPGVRMGALQRLQAIHIATHDSIGTGEDGPTHQPVELAALYRAMPNLLYMRPADSEETAGAFAAALAATSTPSIISLSRQVLPQYPQYSSREGAERGAYVFIEEEEDGGRAADVTLIGVGAEMRFAVDARDALARDHGVRARVVSFPCQRLFERQPRGYRAGVLRRGTPRVVVEAYAAHGWERYAHASYSMRSFGRSLPGAAAYRFFGYDAALIARRVKAFLDDLGAEGAAGLDDGEFRELNVGEGAEH